MRGTWEPNRALVLVPDQQLQLQHQEQSIIEEQRLPLHSPTTPAWSGITDRIVKEEPVEHHEDKNNDSGVSPGHYTSNSASPRSRRSSSTANCSLSPGSTTSQDSNAMQCEHFDYSSQSIYNNCGSSLNYGRLHEMNDLSQHQANEHTAMDVVSNIMKPGCEESEIAQDTLQCPICPLITLKRIQFTQHLASHFATSCKTPDFSKSLLTDKDTEKHHQQQLQMQQPMNGMMGMDEANRASPSQGERSEQESEEADEPGLRVPRVNSQGKVKKFRCKQCNFVAITKLEFWEHSRGHIKAEKLLTCPKCPFVTEYKHHLEYHLRNHFGSKPFKCDKCSYSCVNKSMLNSHLKSHSNVYQYRCANCSYATKYCHSLKLHLRKYSHQPAMVLNADGSPNPLPIIDVYGTRRGPKQKSSNTGSKGQEESSQLINVGLPCQGQGGELQGQLILPQLSPDGHDSSMNPMKAMHAVTNSANKGAMTFPYSQIFTGFPIVNHYSLPNEATEKQFEHLKKNLFVEYAKAITSDRINVDHPHGLENNSLNGNKVNSANFHKVTSPLSKDISDQFKTISLPPKALQAEESTDGKITPLDLSKPDVLANNNNTNTNNNIPQDRVQFNDTGSNTNSPKISGTSRRKGRAVKLDRRVIEAETDDECDKNTERFEESHATNETIAPTVDCCKETSRDRNFGGVGMSNEFTCQYCEIAFGNVVMYTVHMGYHGYKDPYTCNMCGHHCDDKVSFFLHIARSKHS